MEDFRNILLSATDIADLSSRLYEELIKIAPYKVTERKQCIINCLSAMQEGFVKRGMSSGNEELVAFLTAEQV